MKKRGERRRYLSDCRQHRLGDGPGQAQLSMEVRTVGIPGHLIPEPGIAPLPSPPKPQGQARPATGPAGPPADAPLHPLAVPHHDWLRKRGELCIRSGVVTAADATVSFHSDYGPLWQDKPTNQDYALVWHGERAGIPAIGMVIADGVTSSHQSELASQVACAAALQALVDKMDSSSPRAALEAAVAAALQATKDLDHELQLTQRPERSCPPGQFLSTWKYILRQGKILQTTLTLAWLEEDHLCAGVVGDGGCLVRAANLPELRVVSHPDPDTQEVNAFGPVDAGPIPLDYYFAEPLERPFSAIFYTDGVGRGEKEPTRLVESLEEQKLLATDNPARTFLTEAIADAVRCDSHAFDDNLTLAILRAPAARRP